MKTAVAGRRSFVLIVCCLAFVTAFVMKWSVEVAARTPQTQAAAATAAREVALCGGEPCAAVVRGGLAFLDRRLPGLNGNGRACADCHMPTDHFQLSPASVEARFRLMKLLQLFNPDFDDPLFRPIDADDFRTNHDAASDFSNLRQNGLVRVVMQLPLNGRVKLVDPAGTVSSATEVDVWRMVPTVNDVKLTGNDLQNPWFRNPNPTGGYQLDARFATLQEQAHGALVAHAQIKNPVPDAMLDDLASFQRTLFTNNRVRALSNAIDEGTVPLPDPDPRLNELEQQGKAVFQRACAICHGGPGQSTSPLTPVKVIRYHDILTQCPRPVDQMVPARFAFKPCPERLDRNAKTYAVTLSEDIPGPPGSPKAGDIVRRRSSDPGRALLTGYVGGAPPFDDWNKLDVPGLRGIRNTAPYFHNNSADTLEEVVDHYIEVFKFIKVGAPPPPAPAPAVASTDGVKFDRQPAPEERAALLAYLRKL
jgi:hypothetical protein